MDREKLLNFAIKTGVTAAAAIAVLLCFKLLILDSRGAKTALQAGTAAGGFVPPVSVPLSDAGNNIGKNIVIEGTITKSHDSGKVVFLNFKDGLNLYLTCVIFASDFSNFPEKPEEFYLNKKVKVSGRVKEYKGAPEIVLSSQRQISLIQ